MATYRVTTKEELLSHIHKNWRALDAFLSGLTDEQLTTVRDEEGWNVVDHLIHIMAWERSAVFFLQGKPRHEGLGVDEAVYRRGSEIDSADEVNASIREQHAGVTPAKALAQLRAVHAQLLEQLQPLTDADLQQPYQHYLPHEPGDYGDAPAMNVVYGNSAHHFGEHLAWLQKMGADD